MEYSIDKNIIAKSINHYGEEIQATVCMEECAELIQAISKMKRGIDAKDNLAEEIADVLICIEMLKQLYDVDTSSLNDWIRLKQQRELNRIEFFK